MTRKPTSQHIRSHVKTNTVTHNQPTRKPVHLTSRPRIYFASSHETSIEILTHEMSPHQSPTLDPTTIAHIGAHANCQLLIHDNSPTLEPTNWPTLDPTTFSQIRVHDIFPHGIPRHYKLYSPLSIPAFQGRTSALDQPRIHSHGIPAPQSHTSPLSSNHPATSPAG